MSNCMLNELIYLVLTILSQVLGDVILFEDEDIEYWKGPVTHPRSFKYRPVSKHTLLSF